MGKRTNERLDALEAGLAGERARTRLVLAAHDGLDGEVAALLAGLATSLPSGVLVAELERRGFAVTEEE